MNHQENETSAYNATEEACSAACGTHVRGDESPGDAHVPDDDAELVHEVVGGP